MHQQVMVTTESAVSLKPLLETALQNETKLLSHGIRRTQERLRAFEQQFGMRSAEFERKFNARKLDETLDYIDWVMEIKALAMLKEQYNALRGARLD